MCLCVSDWETDTEKRNIFHQQMGIIHAAQVSARPRCTMYSMCEEERKKKYYLFATVLCQSEFQSRIT